MWLPFDLALYLTALLWIGALLLRRSSSRHGVAVRAVLAEAGLVSLLYAFWRLAGRVSVIHLEGAFDRGRWLWDLERALLIPNEQVMQSWILPHGWLVQAANIYYAGAHVPMMGVFLVWMFARHRDLYPQWRNVLASLTLIGVAIQLLPLAPPRLLPELGIVDTPILYGQSVYTTFGDTYAGQLQAMPSLHVGWAALIAVATLRSTTHPGRWLGPLHLALTAWVVVVTGNHFWLDGVAAVVLLPPIMWAERVLRERWQAWRHRSDEAEPEEPATLLEPSSEPART